MMSSQLWEILIKIRRMKPDEKLSCLECFAVMELLVEGAELGIELPRLAEIAQKHLARCPDCREQIRAQLARLAELAV
jgi:hypothetical protein